MIVLVGKSGSGKDTILRNMREWYEPIVSYTTRPRRIGEIDGFHYHFINDDMFDGLQKLEHFAEMTKYPPDKEAENAGFQWKYGIAKQDCKSNRIVIVEPIGLSQLIDIFGRNNIIIIYVEADTSVRYERIKARGDNEKEIARRINSDNNRQDFIEAKKDADFILYNNDNDLNKLSNEVDFFVKEVLQAYIYNKQYNDYLEKYE